MADWVELQKGIGVTFKDSSLLHQAFAHRSFCNENPETMSGSNERLEFLGDAFLGFVVAEYLYRCSADLDEGTMTKARSLVVDKTHLAAVASSLKLGDYLYLGQGEQKGGGRTKPRNLSSALEALIGAILIDQGSPVAERVLLQLLGSEIDRVLKEGVLDDPKSKLQEIVQAKGRRAPVYRVVSTGGPEHDKKFTVEVMVCGLVVGRNCGRSKQEAEKKAAQYALEKWTNFNGVCREEVPE